MCEFTKQEIAAMWLYHKRYSETGLGVKKFYESLSKSEKDVVDEMINDICKSSPKKIRKLSKK